MDIRYLLCGDSAVSIQFGESADVQTNLKVRAMESAIREHKLHGIKETLYTYRSVMLHYDPLLLPYTQLIDYLEKLAASIRWDDLKPDNRVIHIPVFYRVDGTEIQTVADYEKITVDEAIRIHTEREHYIFMRGVQPGGAMVGCPSGSFTIPRKAVPVMKPFASTVTVWGIHTGLSGHRNQAGWYTIGYMPCEVYDHEHPDKPSFLEPGMWVNFFEVNAEESARIHDEFIRGKYMPEITIRESDAIPAQPK